MLNFHTVQATINLYGGAFLGHGWDGSHAAEPTRALGDARPVIGKTLTEAFWEACQALLDAGVSPHALVEVALFGRGEESPKKVAQFRLGRGKALDATELSWNRPSQPAMSLATA